MVKLTRNTYIHNHESTTKKCFRLIGVVFVQDIASLPSGLVEMCCKYGCLMLNLLRVFLEVVNVEDAVSDSSGVIEDKNLWGASTKKY
jgi:hypothetical protein